VSLSLLHTHQSHTRVRGARGACIYSCLSFSHTYTVHMYVSLSVPLSPTLCARVYVCVYIYVCEHMHLFLSTILYNESRVCLSLSLSPTHTHSRTPMRGAGDARAHVYVHLSEHFCLTHTLYKKACVSVSLCLLSSNSLDQRV